ncbi:MAG: J domain-containing protein [Dehalococcoidia bacterium]|nr:J domain-containing protein [Dehalococcoidia bacterium]
MKWEEACRTLGVTEKATPLEIKEQYLYKVQLLHPDKTIDKPEKIRQKAEEELGGVNVAYKFLSEEKNNPFTPPKLEISPSTIFFSDVAINQKKTTDIVVKSVGGPYTNCWIDNSPAPWLVVSGIKATTSEALPLLVTLEAQGIPSVIQQERCSVLVKLRNEKTGLSCESIINVEIAPLLLVTKLRVNKNKLKFNNIPANTVRRYTIDIFNNGSDTLHGYIKTSAHWLSASKNELVLPKRTMTHCIISVDTENLIAGLRDTAYVSICTNGGEFTLPVELQIDKRGKAPVSSYSMSSRNPKANAYGSMQTIAPSMQIKRNSGLNIALWLFLVIMVLVLAAIITLLLLNEKGVISIF